MCSSIEEGVTQSQTLSHALDSSAAATENTVWGKPATICLLFGFKQETTGPEAHAHTHYGENKCMTKFPHGSAAGWHKRKL